MTISQDIQKLEPGTLIVLYELDCTDQGGSLLRFHNGVNGIYEPLIWQGKTYTPGPVEATGFEFSGQGQAPRPKLRVANVNGLMGALVRETRDLLGAKLTRRRTFAKYLDGANFPGGSNPTADPTEEFQPDIFYVDRKATENKMLIEFELSTSYDVRGVNLPIRPIIQNACPWRYRVNDGITSACSYTGTKYFDAQDVRVTSPANDVCGKRENSCKIRFGNVRLPFGGFPGCGLTR